ncbi:hypothetical protein CI105_03555 [Candidatus Izimaplasma bacterium ZiA1]|uniref:NUDIX hydrolase n=1 Tax=Candidatus Izimoplasma sp. ZiA1 TaxID=2024899 RepID=UPI000BAA95C3|nr:hypothetical protein CI105_03555 [Candidatus Izimaplasma bacterium ZiA1]
MNYKDKMIINRLPSSLKLNMEIIDKNVTKKNKNDERLVVRGVVFKENKLLVVFPKDEMIYGTPGGGVDPGETLIDALKRELKEEVGAEKINIIEYIGTMSSLRKGMYDDNTYTPLHHYYLVDILEFGNQSLVDYEQEIGLDFGFVDIDDAIYINEKSLEKRDQEYLDFYTNQQTIIKELKSIYKK